MSRNIIPLLIIVAACGPCYAKSYTIPSDVADNTALSGGGVTWVGGGAHRVGGYNATNDGAAVYVFQLPALAGDETIVTASFDTHMIQIANTPSGAADLYGLGYRTSSTVLGTDFYQGDFGGDGDIDLDDFVILKTNFGT